MKISFGQERIRTDFNPSGNELIAKIKSDTAALIDLLHQADEVNDFDGRLLSLAYTSYEQAAMWAVKAVTG